MERIDTAARTDAPAAGGWAAVRDAIGASIAEAATPQDGERLFPCAMRRAAHPGAGLGVAHGAAGVLYAVHAAGLDVPEEHVEWLARRADRLDADARLGFFDGVHGVAYVLDVLGRREAALRLVDPALARQWQRLGPDLADGLAGVGLSLLHFSAATGDRGMYGAGIEAGRLAAELLGQQAAARAAAGPGTRVSGPAGRAGLLRGASGPALLFLHLFERTGEQDWLVRARSALRMDLACCVVSERDGSMRVNEGWRALPYLAEGSAGIGLVLRRYLEHVDDERFRAALEGIRRACASRATADAGLFNGRAGLVLALADDPSHGRDGAGLAAFPAPGGRWQWRRLSADLAAGSAGVLLAAGAAAGDRSARLPFLGGRPAGGERSAQPA